MKQSICGVNFRKSGAVFPMRAIPAYKVNFADLTAECKALPVIDASITHNTIAVIANEVKQSSKTKMHFLNHLDCHVGFASSQ
ncbi:MAG: hypothetical protein ACYCY7_01995 [Gallionella sp.]